MLLIHSLLCISLNAQNISATVSTSLSSSSTTLSSAASTSAPIVLFNASAFTGGASTCPSISLGGTTASNSSFGYLFGIKYTGSDLYVTDFTNNVIRKMNISKAASFVYAGNGQAAYLNGQATTAAFNGPTDVEVASNGYIYVSEGYGNRIRVISNTGSVSLVAGSTSSLSGIVNSNTGANARFNYPSSIALSPGQTYLYVADANNKAVRRVTLSSGAVSTLATFRETVLAVYCDTNNNLYIGTSTRIFVRYNSGNVYAFAGNAGTGLRDGQGDSAYFDSIGAITKDSCGNLYVADTNNHALRLVTPLGLVVTIVGGKGSGTTNGFNATLTYPVGITILESGTKTELYVTERGNCGIRRITFGACSSLSFVDPNSSGDGSFTVITVPSPYPNPYGDPYPYNSSGGDVGTSVFLWSLIFLLGIFIVGYMRLKSLGIGCTFHRALRRLLYYGLLIDILVLVIQVLLGCTPETERQDGQQTAPKIETAPVRTEPVATQMVTPTSATGVVQPVIPRVLYTGQLQPHVLAMPPWQHQQAYQVSQNQPYQQTQFAPVGQDYRTQTFASAYSQPYASQYQYASYTYANTTVPTTTGLPSGIDEAPPPYEPQFSMEYYRYGYSSTPESVQTNQRPPARAQNGTAVPSDSKSAANQAGAHDATLQTSNTNATASSHCDTERSDRGPQVPSSQLPAQYTPARNYTHGTYTHADTYQQATSSNAQSNQTSEHTNAGNEYATHTSLFSSMYPNNDQDPKGK